MKKIILENYINFINYSKKKYGRGIIIVIEGVESVGKTTTCNMLHNLFLLNKLNSSLLTDFYERTGKSGPLIAAITENPTVKLNDNLTLFLLYCARLADKVYLAYELSKKYDIVIVDRLDLSLYARAEVAWNLELKFVGKNLKWICSRLYRDADNVFMQCLNANIHELDKRNKMKTIRRRSFMPKKVQREIQKRVLELAVKRKLDIIDTSTISPLEVISQIEKNIDIFIQRKNVK